MTERIKILFAEDLSTDHELAKRAIDREAIAYEARLVETEEAFRAALEQFQPDIVVSDFKMPSFDGMHALRITQQMPTVIPFIVLTGSINELVAVECMKAGATDYVMKEHLSRLPFAILEAIKKTNTQNTKIAFERALADSELRYRTFINSTTDMVFLKDAEFRHIIANDALCAYFGKPLEEVVGKTDYELMSKDLADDSRQTDLESLESGARSITTKQYFDRYIEVVKFPVEIGQGRTGIGGYIRDITERKTAEQALIESEIKYRDMVEGSADAIAIYIQGKIVYANAACAPLIRASSVEELIGMEVIGFVHPDSRALVIKRMQEVMVQRHTLPIAEEKFVRLDGSTVEVEVRAFPVMFNSQPAVQLIIRDISEKKEHEQALQRSRKNYRDIITYAPIGIYQSSLDGKIISANPRFAKMLGYDDPEELIGKKSFGRDIYWNAAEREALIEKHLLLDFAENLELKWKKKDGTPVWVSLSAHVKKDDRNNAVSFEGFVQDISQRKQAESERRASEKKFRDLFDDAPVGYHEIDATGAIVQVNQTELKMLGYKAEEMLNKPVWEFVKDSERSRAAVTAKLQGHVTPAAIFEREFKRKDGTLISVLVEDRIMKDAQDTIIGIRTTIQDYTEYKKAQVALKQSEERFRSVTKSAYDAIITSSSNGNILEWNTGAERMFGYTEGEIIGLPMSRLIPPKYKDVHERGLKRVSEGGEYHVVGHTTELEGLHKNGEIFPVELSLAVWETDGQKYYTGIIRDISERKKSEAELIKLSRAVEQSPASVMITDTNTNIEYVNPKFEALTGYRLHEVLGKNPRMLKSGKTSAEEYKQMWSVITSGGTWYGEFCNKRKDGSYYWEYASISPIRGEAGVITHYLAVKEDITEWKIAMEKAVKSEKQFRSVWENSHDGMRLLDQFGKVINVNQSYCDILEQKADAIVGKPFAFSYHCENSAKEIDSFRFSFQQRNIPHIVEREICLLTGGRKWVALTNSFIESENNELLLLSIVRDITQSRLLFEQLQSAKERAEELNRAKTSFFANMSHELRTPLIGVLGFTEILEDELSRNLDQLQMIQTIRNSGERLLRTLNSILNISKFEADKIEANLRPQSIVPILQDVSNLYSGAARGKNISLSLDFSGEEIVCNIDSRLFNSTIENLLNNSVRFTEKGGITIFAYKRGEEACVEITDTGIGISDDKQAVIWEEFRQASEGLSRNYEGTGLGLTLAKKYTELMHGRIELHSEEGKGSTFSVILPLSKIPVLTPAQAPVAAVAESTETPHRQFSMLYVEDDEIAVDLVLRYTKDLYLIDTAPEGESAMELAKSKQYDAVLMDINLRKGLDGIELTQEMRRLPGYSKTPVIAITAYALIEDQMDFLSRGVTHYLSKPFTKKELLAKLEDVFTSKS